ncbi:MAG: GNAT family N-acetyltransferase [bacterium]
MADTPGIVVRETTGEDQEFILRVMREQWGSDKVVTRGRVHIPAKLPGLIAEIDGESVGLITYDIYGRECELITMNALKSGLGIGSALLGTLAEIARDHNCRGIWLITTNDNVDAMRFYQRKGFYFVAVHRDAIKYSRKLKPEIPEIGNHGIPIRDEIELVMPL